MRFASFVLIAALVAGAVWWRMPVSRTARRSPAPVPVSAPVASVVVLDATGKVTDDRQAETPQPGRAVRSP